MKVKNTSNKNTGNTKKNHKKYNLEINKAQEIIIWNQSWMNKKKMKVYRIAIKNVKITNSLSKD
jgi:hypothetical protein